MTSHEMQHLFKLYIVGEMMNTLLHHSCFFIILSLLSALQNKIIFPSFSSALFFARILSTDSLMGKLDRLQFSNLQKFHLHINKFINGAKLAMSEFYFPQHFMQ